MKRKSRKTHSEPEALIFAQAVNKASKKSKLKQEQPDHEIG